MSSARIAPVLCGEFLLQRAGDFLWIGGLAGRPITRLAGIL
jgi:hypothetical protein